MKTTRTTVSIQVTRFSMGDDWARFEARSDSTSVLFTNSRGARIPTMSREAALTQMAALVAGRWTPETTSATLPAWAVAA